MKKQGVDSQFHLQYQTNQNKWALYCLICRCSCVLGAIYIVMDGLAEIASKAPEQMNALSNVIAAMELSNVLPWILTIIMGASWHFERKGKKRAIKKSSRLQKELEAKDPNRTSSGLTETGDTPGGDHE